MKRDMSGLYEKGLNRKKGEGRIRREGMGTDYGLVIWKEWEERGVGV